ncbi:hypothetical protein MBLNU457_3351t1 [Dothideomycetes sp. NU457]
MSDLYGSDGSDVDEIDCSDHEQSHGNTATLAVAKCDRKKQEEIALGSMQTVLKHLDHRWTERGQRYYAETPGEDLPEQVNWWEKYALCLTRELDSKNDKVESTFLRINSEHLTKVLRETIKYYPGLALQAKTVSIRQPYHVLFHYRNDFTEKLNGDGTEAQDHLQLLVDFINQQFEDTIRTYDNIIPEGRLSFDLLWTIYRPGCTVYSRVRGALRAFNLVSYHYGQDICGRYLALDVGYVDFDGEDFGNLRHQLITRAFDGFSPISGLVSHPLSFNNDAACIRERLIERGQRFEKYAGMHFAQYKGVAFEKIDRIENEGLKRVNIDGRVVVDTATYHRINGNEEFEVDPFPRTADQERQVEEDDEWAEGTAFQPLTDDQRLICSSLVRGFSFAEKLWLEFSVDQLSPIQWNDKCFDQLVLPTTQKHLVQALVSEHTLASENAFDDVIKGKGRGLIFVLHGPPGVGKTLTAECVAEYSRRPLYIVSSGDLGTASATLNKKLEEILDLASTWKAVMLIDEADVFLERRSLHDMERNALVSIFLRVLEYYQGMLFLTSNRVDTFDDAFKSRIHVPLKYSDLPFTSRVQIWQNFLAKIQGTKFSERDLEHLAEHPLNGRQIKNIVRTAQSLSNFSQKTLDLQALSDVIGIQNDFEHELGLSNGTKVNRLCISPDKRFLAAAGHHTVKLYDIKSTNPAAVLTFEGHTSNITGVAFHCEGKWMVTSSEDGTVKIWDTRTGHVQRNYSHGVPVNDVVIHPNQGELISCDRGGNVRIWDLGENKCSHQLIPEEDKSVASVTVASDGSLLCAAVSNSVHGAVYVWRMITTKDVTTLVPVTKFRAHNTYITRVLLSPDVRHLATCSADHTARIWTVDLSNPSGMNGDQDQANGMIENQPFHMEQELDGHQRWVWDCAFSADSAYLVTACSDHYARLWELASKSVIRQYNGHHRGAVCVALNDYSETR